MHGKIKDNFLNLKFSAAVLSRTLNASKCFN
jgi:hypothetical protein